MIPGLDMPHNMLGHLALEAQMRNLQGSRVLNERERLERHLGMSTIDALRLLLDGVPQKHIRGDCFRAPLNEKLMKHYLGATLAGWDLERPYYLSPIYQV